MIESEIADNVIGQAHSSADALRFERLLSGLAADFIVLPADQIDDAIENGLRRIIETLGIDRSTLSSVDPDTGQFHAMHSVAAPGLPPVPKTVSSRTFPWVLAKMRAGEAIVFSNLDELPPEAALDRMSYASIGLRSHVAIPVSVSGELMAVLGFGAIASERAWSDDLVARMRLLADIFASALARKRAQMMLDRALGFERLLADISASLVGADESELDADVVAGLRDVAKFFDVDRGTLWKLLPPPVRLIATHRWQADDVLPVPEQVGVDEIPWILGEVIAGDVVNLTAINDLPPEAGVDASSLRAAGIRSLITVPLRTKGDVIGALSMSSLRDARIWPDDVVPRLRLLGKMLVGALAQGKAERDARRSSAETAQFRDRLAHVARVHTVGAMSAAIAHEINQPLMAIENYAAAGRTRLDGERSIDRAKLDELLGKIVNQAATAGEVLDRLRSMVKSNDTDAAEVDIAQLIVNTLKLIEMESQLKEIRVETAIAAHLPHAFIDEIQIQQVILNLTHNAMEAMAGTSIEDKVVRVEATTNADQIVVRVLDRGPGVGASDEEKIYEPFYTTKGTGLGIGLSICRAMIEAHGGSLTHVSNLPAGAIFQFTLPIAKDGA